MRNITVARTESLLLADEYILSLYKQPLYLSDLKHKGLFLLVSCIHTESAEGPCLSSIGIQAADQQLSQILLYQYNRHL